jgi:hypothetical protein
MILPPGCGDLLGQRVQARQNRCGCTDRVYRVMMARFCLRHQNHNHDLHALQCVYWCKRSNWLMICSDTGGVQTRQIVCGCTDRIWRGAAVRWWLASVSGIKIIITRILKQLFCFAMCHWCKRSNWPLQTVSGVKPWKWKDGHDILRSYNIFSLTTRLSI